MTAYNPDSAKEKIIETPVSTPDTPCKAVHNRLCGIALIIFALLTIAVQLDMEYVDITAAVFIGLLGLAELLPSSD